MPPPTRNTRQRHAIRHAIDAADRPLAPREILEITQRDGVTVSLATIYRTVKSLLDENEIVAVELPGQPPRYESSGKDHHHHFHCDACGRAFDLPGCPGNFKGLAPEGFTVERHELTLYGRCPNCSIVGMRRSDDAAQEIRRPTG